MFSPDRRIFGRRARTRLATLVDAEAQWQARMNDWAFESREK